MVCAVAPKGYGEKFSCRTFWHKIEVSYHKPQVVSVDFTLSETNIAPGNGWLEYFIVSFWGPAYFQGRTFSFRECISHVHFPPDRLFCKKTSKRNCIHIKPHSAADLCAIRTMKPQLFLFQHSKIKKIKTILTTSNQSSKA